MLLGRITCGWCYYTNSIGGDWWWVGEETYYETQTETFGVENVRESFSQNELTETSECTTKVAIRSHN